MRANALLSGVMLGALAVPLGKLYGRWVVAALFVAFVVSSLLTPLWRRLFAEEDGGGTPAADTSAKTTERARRIEQLATLKRNLAKDD